MIAYNFSTLIIKHSKADSVAIKGLNVAVKVYNLVDGVAQINTDNWTAGQYSVQYFVGDQIIGEDQLIVKQNLKHTDSNYDPRSKARIILEAIEAYLAGVATHQQKKVKVGQKEIEYSTFDELIKWRNFYQKEALKEEGKPTQIRHEKLFYRQYLRGGII